MTGEPTVEEQALSLADEVLTLRARLRERDDELDRLRAENADLAAQVERIHSRRVEDLHADGATIDRLRTENEALAAALSDIAGMVQPNGTGRWISDAECAGFGPLCWDRYPTRPGEWCSACVAEVAWSAWKLGVLG